jgi:Mor family transcriptional regulator
MMVHDYLSGMTIRQVALKHDTTYSAVRWHLVKAGVTLRTRATVKKVLPDNEIASEYEQGATIYGLAKKHKVSRATIINRLKKEGSYEQP